MNNSILFSEISGYVNTLKMYIKLSVILWLFLSLFLFTDTSVHAFETTNQEGICAPNSESSTECTDASLNSQNSFLLRGPNVEKKSSETSHVSKDETSLTKTEKTAKHKIEKAPAETRELMVYFFWGKGCPHCEEEKIFLNEMKKKYLSMKIIDYEVWYNKQNALYLSKMAGSYNLKTSGVPVTFVGENAFVGFSKQSKEEIAESIRKCLSFQCIDPSLIASGKISIDKIKGVPETGKTSERAEDLECKEKNKTVYIQWIGKLDASEMSLPVITFVIAGLDSFNPCAFFVLFSLLGLLIHARSRKKMFLIGSVFIFFSGFIYFLFMAAWLNLFLLMGQVAVITKIAGAIAILIAAINIKDFFAFKKGVSLTIPDSAKPKLFDKMRKLIKSTSLLSILFGTAVLAIAANSYELLCTAGFPLVFTRILTLNNLSTIKYYMYLVLYNSIYIIPLAIIVFIFTITLGRKILTEWQGRLLKLVSGTMMLGLGGILFFNPAILNSIFISLILLLGALLVSTIVALVVRKLGYL
jgi:thiol-disulfide isomerase/thioredoxin